LHNELVHRGDERPNSLQPLGELEALEALAVGFDDLGGHGSDPGRRVASIARHHASGILADHGQRAAGQVAEPVGQVRIVAADQRVVAEAAVLAKHHFAQQE